MKGKIGTILIVISIIIMVSYTILSREIGDLDEIWNYNIARAISEGNLPYKDVSMITGPLLHSINGLILKVFTNQLLTLRILAIILITSIIFLIYCILRKLKINTSLSIIATFTIAYLMRKYFCIDYNFFVLFLTLMIIFLEINNKNCKNYKRNFLIGFLGGLCVITKQTTGMLICTSIIGYNILIILFEKYQIRCRGRRSRRPEEKQYKNNYFCNCGNINPFNYFYYILINFKYTK